MLDQRFQNPNHLDPAAASSSSAPRAIYKRLPFRRQ